MEFVRTGDGAYTLVLIEEPIATVEAIGQTSRRRSGDRTRSDRLYSLVRTWFLCPSSPDFQ